MQRGRERQRKTEIFVDEKMSKKKKKIYSRRDLDRKGWLKIDFPIVEGKISNV